MILKLLRNAAGYIIVLGDRLTRPKPIVRTPEDQARVQAGLQGHSLYQLFACPFCVKTRRAVHRMNVSLENRDIGKNINYRSELEQGGGKVKVPCLRIEEEGKGVRWLYESDDIIAYIETRVNAAS